MTRNLLRCWLVSLLLGPACALALEIGEIQVDSALNQLFDAKIPLPTLAPEDLAKISVKTAAPSMFAEFGLDRSVTLDHLVFSIQYDAEGRVYVKVVSTKPIREPSLALLLEFGWPRGKTFREFSVFLDPVQRLTKRPSDRSKTVLDPPASAGSKPVAGTPAAGIGAAETAESVHVSPSAEPSPPPGKTWVYRPGDIYGPVAPGEGLWAIALKLRPDPGVTREQMMQALFRANPQAFSRAGIDGLRVGAVLRIPTLQEIADFTGSTVARQLAMAEQATSAGVVGAQPNAAPMEAVKPDGNLAVFPLAPPAALDPTPPPPAPPPESAQPTPAAAAAKMALESAPLTPTPPPPAPPPESAQPTPAAAAAKMALESAPLTPTPPPPAPPPESAQPAVLALEVPATHSEPVAIPPEPAVPTLEPVSATPLLFLAVSEMLATITQVPTAAVPESAPSASSTTDATAPEPVREAAASAAVPATVVPEPVIEAVMATPTVATPPPLTASVLTTEEDGSRTQSNLPPPSVSAATPPSSPVATPDNADPLDARARPEIARAGETKQPSTGAAESTAPPVAESARATEPPAGPIATPYKGGDSYGPVAANERLWDIAAKIRPDPGIGKDIMMRALFAVNPQAFSKPNMDSLKVGATLRIPTLLEIVKHTGSKAAQQLLEQQRAVESKAVDAVDAAPQAPSAVRLTPGESAKAAASSEPSLGAVDGMASKSVTPNTAPTSGEAAAGASPASSVANPNSATKPEGLNPTAPTR